MMRDIASHIPTIVGSVPTPQDNGTSAMVWKEPYGVVSYALCDESSFQLYLISRIVTLYDVNNYLYLKPSENKPTTNMSIS
jgi:hypothetical protein